uniref:Uncharacterized protein n=1 Tax=Moniliophthora roreri TaxID=221103 RepID=A0A0W0GBW0_MONRR
MPHMRVHKDYNPRV